MTAQAEYQPPECAIVTHGEQVARSHVALYATHRTRWNTACTHTGRLAEMIADMEGASGMQRRDWSDENYEGDGFYDEY